MGNLIIRWVISALAIFCTGYLLHVGVHVRDFTTAFILALVLGIINVTIKPLLLLLTFPITLVTLGLFTFVINAFLVLLSTKIVPGFTVDSFWWALLFSIVLSIINSFLLSLSSK